MELHRTVTGTLYGIGVGPGDPELITLKALRLLRECEVLAYPAPDEGASLVRRFVAGHLDNMPAKTEIVMRMPMVAARFPAQAVYDEAAETIAGHLQAGRDVAALCEGDPFFYGSFMYLFGRLSERFPLAVVPGVSSLTASAARLGAPLAARDDRLLVLPATLDEETLAASLAAAESIAFIKVGRHLDKIRRLLAAADLEDSARYIERATMDSERSMPLGAAPASAPYFSMVLVHRRGEAWRLDT